MAGQNMKQVMAIEWKNKKRILAVNPNVDDGSGIYFLTRQDENGFKFAYIGQAKHLLARLAQHLSGYQHIDLSLKKHGLYSADNPDGWKINFQHYSIDELDEKEQFFIKQYALAGYQLRNKTSGSQGEGKAKIAEYRPAKGYREGLAQGRKSLARELSHIIEKHLDVQIKPEKQGNKISEKAFEKFRNLLNERGEDHEE
jgi:hypothetical protein|nr:MAG TPA_asm: GIY-YIG nuclease superfamily protein [Caudoviricetes sp.]